MAQRAAASRRDQIAQKRREEERAKKKAAYPNATRVFVNKFNSFNKCSCLSHHVCLM